jgi:homoserine dehydrogenase
MTIDPAVLKFGSSVLRTRYDIQAVVSEIRNSCDQAEKVVVVVSAFGGETNRLIDQAMRKKLLPTAPDYARLIASGELESASVLNAALQSTGLRARMMTPRKIGFMAKGDTNNATPFFADAGAIHRALKDVDIVIIPGFSAINQDGDIVLLGRGGSDITAIFMGRILGAKSVRLIKDVDGLYDKDPNLHADARRFVQVSWGQALEVCGSLIQHKAVRFAEDCGLAIEIAAIGQAGGTSVGDYQWPVFESLA